MEMNLVPLLNVLMKIQIMKKSIIIINILNVPLKIKLQDFTPILEKN